MVAQQTPVPFTDDDISDILDSLAARGWKNVSRVAHDFPGMLNFTQPQTYDYDGSAADKGDDISGSPEHKAWVAKFLADSGIAAVLRRYGTEISPTPDDNAHLTLFWGYVGGYRTETYLRIFFTPDGTLSDAQLYAVRLEPLFNTDAVLPLEDAIQNAFYCGESTGLGDQPYTITHVGIVYQSGLPFYALSLGTDSMGGPFVGYALAVDEDALRADAGAYAAYEALLENGIW
jgi:hypothetical protein